MRAVRFDRYGGVDELHIREVPDPQPTPGRAIVRVKAAAINPGEIMIRIGALEAMYPATFPSGEGSDFSGEIVSLGAGATGFSVGDAVLGWSDERASHAELVSMPVEQLVAKPEGLSWDVAGSMYVAPMAALASVGAVAPRDGDMVVVSAAAGGVGVVAVQLVKRAGATVIGLAGADNHEWLRAHGVVPVLYGDGQEERIRAAAGGRVDAFIDLFGAGYVDLALALGVPTDRINTIADFQAVQEKGVKGQGTGDAGGAAALGGLVALAASGDLDIPIARTYPLSEVREAYRLLADRHTHGKIVLHP